MVAPSRKLPPVIYQVDSQNTASGRILASTKRRACWRYGHVDNRAVLNGNSGADCRGKEHEITLIWSLASGKKRVFHNSKEVHFSVGNRTNGKFTVTWSSREHFFTLIAYAFPPSSRIKPKKQFELLINGYSFDNLPRIYELGLKDSFHGLTDPHGPSPQNENAMMSTRKFSKHPIPSVNPLGLNNGPRPLIYEQREYFEHTRM